MQEDSGGLIFLSRVVQYLIVLGVRGEGFIDPAYHPFTRFMWNDLGKFRTGPRTIPPTVSATGPGRPLSSAESASNRLRDLSFGHRKSNRCSSIGNAFPN